MAFRDFISERRLLSTGGRRFIVRKPTVATVHLVLGHFYAEIELAWKAAAASGRDDVPASLVLPFFLAADTDALATVLATCCELVGGVAGETELTLASNPEMCKEVAWCLLSLCKPARVVRSLQLEKIFGPKDPKQDIPEIPELLGDASPHELLMASLAERFAISPFEILDWPYEAFLSMVEDILPSIEKIKDRVRRGEDSSPAAAEWLTAENNQFPGVETIRIP